MNLRDRLSSLRTGSFPDTPSGVPSRDEELAELRDLMIRAAHDVEHMTADRREMYLELVGAKAALREAEQLIVDRDATILVLETEVARFYGVMG